MKKQDNDIKTIKIYYLHRGNNIPFYIGKTKNPPNRLSGHRTKFGLNVFLEIIDIVPQNQTKFWESYWMEQFRQWGFILENKNKGGGGLSKHSEETKQKISNIWKIKSKDKKQEINLKRGKGNKGIKKPNAGYRNWKKEDIDRLKKSSPFNQPNWSDKCKKIVLMLDKNNEEVLREFGSVTEASYILGISQGTLSHCLTGRSKTSSGFKWKYKE